VKNFNEQNTPYNLHVVSVQYYCACAIHPTVRMSIASLMTHAVLVGIILLWVVQKRRVTMEERKNLSGRRNSVHRFEPLAAGRSK